MSIRTGNLRPYPEFREHYPRDPAAPVIWQWKTVSEELGGAEHTEYGTVTLSTPDGSFEVIPGTSMTFQVVKPGERTTPHSHTWWHLYLVRSGAGSVVFDESHGATEVDSGDVVLIPAWAVHHFENRGADEDLLLINISNLPQQAALHNLISR